MITRRTATPPFVSVVIPIRNEASFIARTLDAIVSQDYPIERTEILITDGMSDDGTREIVRQYAERFPHIRMIDNPQRITPCGLNTAIIAARGDIICRIDGHCKVAIDFLSQNVQLLSEHPEAWIVGGPIVHHGTGSRGEAVAIAMAHPLGVGLASHRFANFEGYVDTVQFPTFRRSVIERVGAFDATLVRTEDDEFSYRVARAGGMMFISPKVRYVYYVRDRVGKLFLQYFQYSFWRIPVLRKHRMPTTVRQIVPLLFFLTVSALIIFGVTQRHPFAAAALPLAYALAMVAVGISFVPRKGWLVASLVPAAMVTMHTAYALGMGYGLLAALFRVRAWEHDGAMATPSR